MTTTTDYQQQAIDFLQSTGIIFSANYLRTGKYFSDDKEERDIYEITLKRGNREYKFEFGQSIANSGKYIGHKHLCLNTFDKIHFSEKEYQDIKRKKPFEIRNCEITLNKNYKEPTAYDILACLTKYDPSTFEDFCSELGYDTDSKKAEKIYNAVCNEWLNVSSLFTDTEIEQLQDIN